MIRLALPYGLDRTVSLEIPARNYVETVTPKGFQSSQDDAVLIEKTLDNPVGTDGVASLVTGKHKVAILVDDYARPTPAAKILPVLLQRLLNAGISGDRVSIIFALGTHRRMSQAEIEKKIGKDIAEEYRIVNRSVHEDTAYTYLGESGLGIPIHVMEEVFEADFRIGIGSIVPHCDVGYSGGAKIVLPGVCSAETVSANHMLGLLFNGKNMLGAPTTLIREDIEDVVGRIGLDVVINAITDQEGKLYALVCGDFIKAHREGVKSARDVYEIPIQKRADIAICSTCPGDVDFVQVCKTYWSGDKMVKPGGDLIIVTPCTEGVGPYRQLPDLMGRSSDEIEKAIVSGELAGTDGVMGSLAIRLNRIAERINVSMVTGGLSLGQAQQMGLPLYASASEALSNALDRQGRQASVAAMTHGGSTYPCAIDNE